MTDYCAAWFSHSGLLELTLSDMFHDLFCYSPLSMNSLLPLGFM